MAAGAAAPRGLDRLELRIERLRTTFRFTYAFHAREVRFERSASARSGTAGAEEDRWERLFPETFSFHANRHDPTELFLQLDDLLRKGSLVSERANARDARQLVTRLCSQVPRYLAEMRDRLEREGRLQGSVRVRLHQDVALLSQIFLRFIETRDLEDNRQLRIADFALRKLVYECLLVVMEERVEPKYLEDYVAGAVDPVDRSDDPSESGFFYALEAGDSDLVNRMVLRMAERAFYLWIDGVCLDEDNHAFEKEDSPFAEREREVLSAIAGASGVERIARGDELVPFLRRPGRDSRRLLSRLETWFLRRYDIHHSSAIIHHAARIERGESQRRGTISFQTPRLHALTLFVLAAPFVGAAFFYERSPAFFDWWCTGEVVIVNLFAFWFLIWRFCVRRDLTFFNASVPRIFAGVIVGYLPVFLIDEVWDLASRDALAVAGLTLFLALATLLYIYVEVRRRLGNTDVAFSRARAIFLLGVLQALVTGLVMTTIVGRYMVVRNWSPQGGDEVSIETLRASLDPVIGQLPRIIGFEPVLVFPAVVLLMTFLSFFIGIFLQLMWEDLPITEPL